MPLALPPWRASVPTPSMPQTSGGMGPGTIAALEALLVGIARFPDALFCSATDANGPGDRFADRHQLLARKFGIPFVRLRPSIEGGDWNEVLRAQSYESQKEA